MKTVLSLIIAVVFSLNASAQQKPTINLSWEEPIQTINNKQYELIDVDEWGSSTIKITKFNDDGSIHQTGYLVDGKKNGVWTMYQNGSVISELQYNYNYRVWTKVYRSNGHDLVFYKDNKPVIIRSEQVLASN